MRFVRKQFAENFILSELELICVHTNGFKKM